MVNKICNKEQNMSIVINMNQVDKLQAELTDRRLPAVFRMNFFLKRTSDCDCLAVKLHGTPEWRY